VPKRKFSYSERAAIWQVHGPRCGVCHEPLSLLDTTIDHFLPERLQDDEPKLRATLEAWGLPLTFDVNNFENWFPAHSICNSIKSGRVFEFSPLLLLEIRKNIERAPRAAKRARQLSSNVAKEKVLATLFVGLENRSLGYLDLLDVVQVVAEDLPNSGVPADFIVLDDGYWTRRDQIVRESDCACDRTECVGHSSKVHCYFTDDLQPWVIQAGLFRACYDEIVRCPRCNAQHKRGHIGREQMCGNPFRDQLGQHD
jgi:5-methylcytosine-specific restriction endonuclease McrA